MFTTIFEIDVRNLVLILVALFNFALGISIFFKNIKDKINIYFVFTTITTALWAFGLVMFRHVSEPSMALLWAKVYYLAAALIGTSFLSFSFVFPFRKYQPRFFYRILFYLFTGFIVVVSIWPNLMLKEIVFNPWGKDVSLGWPYYIYVTYFVLCMIGAFGNFIQKYQTSSSIEKLQIQYVFLGTVLAAIWGTTFNLFLPLLGNYKLIWLGPYFTLVMIGFLTYSILKHHLMNIKIIATEVFSVLIPLILLVDALLAETRTEFILKLGIFIGVAIFSILLIKAVLNEVRTRERIGILAQKLRRANVRLKKLDKAKSEFISIASHQLRTPLSIIKGFLSMILEKFYGPISETVQDKMQKTLESNERLIKLVDHLLDLSHMDEGRMQFNFKRVALRGVVESTFEEYKLRAQAKKLKFIYQPPEKDNLFVQADDEKIRQVIGNLIDNAIKYTAKGKVEVSLRREGDEVVLRVKDTGIGILPEEKKDFFEKFSRGRRVSRIWTEGAGLGLYVARFIVEAHHGQIGVESEGEGKGSEFWVRLPVAG